MIYFTNHGTNKIGFSGTYTVILDLESILTQVNSLLIYKSVYSDSAPMVNYYDVGDICVKRTTQVL